MQFLKLPRKTLDNHCRVWYIINVPTEGKQKNKNNKRRATQIYNFNKQSQIIITEGFKYGVKIAINPQTKHLQFTSDFRGSDSVQKYLTRKIKTYNNHVDQGF